MLKNLLRVVAVAAVSLAIVPTPADASPGDTATFAFRGHLSIGAWLYAPGLGPSAPSGAPFQIWGTGPFCAGTATTSSGQVAGPWCEFAAAGTLNVGVTGLGIYCDNFGGSGMVSKAVVGDLVTPLQGAVITFVQSASRTLSFTVLGGPRGAVAHGTATLTDASPGECGLARPTFEFMINGFVTGVGAS